MKIIHEAYDLKNMLRKIHTQQDTFFKPHCFNKK